MQFLFTGLIGSGKTLNAIKAINEESHFKDRPVYYTHIKELKLGWTYFEPELLDNWWDNFPPNSIILVDEAHYYFPNLGNLPLNKRPQSYLRLTEQRHAGVDFVFITQFPDQLDKHVRKHSGQHRHFVPLPPFFGKLRVKEFRFPKYMDDPDYMGNWKYPGTIKKSYSLDKKYYGLYKTADKVTTKPKFPTLLATGIFVFFVALSFIVYSIFSTSNSLTQPQPDSISQTQTNTTDTQLQIDNLQRQIDTQSHIISEYQDINSYKSSIDSLPWTAPIYQEHLTVQSLPYISGCSNFGRVGQDNCKCYTQQSAIIHMSNDMCLLILENGIHQPHIKDSVLTNHRANNIQDNSSNRGADGDIRRAPVSPFNRS